MVAELQDRIGDIHGLRRDLSANKEQMRFLRETFEAENAGLIGTIDDLSADLAREEDVLRTAAIRIFEADPEHSKQVTPGVVIQEKKVFTFDADHAYEWALEHRVCLKLDEPAYKKIMVMAKAPGEVETKIVATLSQDFSPIVMVSEEA